MPRARNIKPSLFKNEILGAADPLLTILFESLWCLADRDGILEDRPLRIKAESFPYRDVDVNGYLTELERLDFIWRYKDSETPLIQVCKFGEHQHPHSTEKPSVFRGYKEVSALTVKQPLNNGYATSDSLNTETLNTDSFNPQPEAASEFPLRELYAAFPSLELTSGQIGMIQAEVKPEDAEAWKLTVEKYLANYNPAKGRYMPDKVGNVLSVLQSKRGEVDRNGNSSKNRGKRSDQQTIAESADFYANYPES